MTMNRPPSAPFRPDRALVASSLPPSFNAAEGHIPQTVKVTYSGSSRFASSLAACIRAKAAR